MSQKDFDSRKDQKRVLGSQPEVSNGDIGKKVTGSLTSGAAVFAIVMFFLTGLLGGTLCVLGIMAVYGIMRTKLALPIRIVLSVVTALIFVALLIAFVLLSSILSVSVEAM